MLYYVDTDTYIYTCCEAGFLLGYGFGMALVGGGLDEDSTVVPVAPDVMVGGACCLRCRCSPRDDVKSLTCSIRKSATCSHQS